MLLHKKVSNESFSNFSERLVKSRKNNDILKELKGFFEFKNKEGPLKELSEKRTEVIY